MKIAALVMVIAIASYGSTVLAQASVKSLPHAESRAALKAASVDRHLNLQSKVWVGDFDGMLDRRIIRVAAPYSRSLFYIDKGRERGITTELVRDFERWVNRKYAKQLGKRPLTIVISARSRDKLLTDVTSGLMDIAVGNLTETEERLKVVDFVTPDDVPKVNEIVVTGPKSLPIASLDDLSGKTVQTRRSSSYYDSLVAQNARFTAAAKPEMKIVLVADSLEDEDMMEMINAGLLETIVVDDWKAKAWATVFRQLKMHEEIVMREGGKIGWAVRKDNPKLKAELNDFYSSWAKKQGVIPYRLSQTAKRVKKLSDPSSSADFKRFEDTVALFAKYGRQYGFDPVMLAAQGYQESALNQSKRSRVGAIGVMQIMPATGAQLKVGDITVTEPNIHAGAKYMDQLMTNFPDAKWDSQNRSLFAFASYNAGPGNISRMRNEAEKRGLDPDVWFNNVETVTAEKIGIETTTYVRNIYKYYASYRLILDAEERAQKARDVLSK